MLFEMEGEKFQRKVRFEKKRKQRKQRKNKHHMTNKCKGGKNIPSNMLDIKIERHAALHHYFRNMSWEEIGDALFLIFQMREPEKCYELVRRISRLKGRSNA